MSRMNNLALRADDYVHDMKTSRLLFSHSVRRMSLLNCSGSVVLFSLTFMIYRLLLRWFVTRVGAGQIVPFTGSLNAKKNRDREMSLQFTVASPWFSGIKVCNCWISVMSKHILPDFNESRPQHAKPMTWFPLPRWAAINITSIGIVTQLQRNNAVSVIKRLLVLFYIYFCRTAYILPKIKDWTIFPGAKDTIVWRYSNITGDCLTGTQLALCITWHYCVSVKQFFEAISNVIGSCTYVQRVMRKKNVFKVRR